MKNFKEIINEVENTFTYTYKKIKPQKIEKIASNLMIKIDRINTKTTVLYDKNYHFLTYINDKELVYTDLSPAIFKYLIK